jgi:hypothetical protein
MHFLDVVALTLMGLSTLAMALGQAALARAEDFEALYWLTFGIAGLAAAVQLTRPGKW